MDFEPSEEQKQILSLIRDFCKKENSKELDAISDKAAVANNIEELRAIIPRDLIKKMHAVGLRQLAVPKKYGGGGHHDWLTLTLAAEEAGYVGGVAGRLLSLPWKHTADVAACATPEQQDWFFEQFMADHSMFVAASTSEPESATDYIFPYDEPGVALRTRAVKDGNEWVINGNKMFCSGAGVSELILVGVRTADGPVSESMSRFWVRKDSPGMTMEVNKFIMADMTGNCQIHFDNVRVPEHHLSGELNKGWPKMDIRLGNKIMHFATNLGIYRKLLEQLADYTKQRIVGGKPQIEHPNVAEKLGEAAINLEVCRAYFYKAAWESDKAEKEGGPLAVSPFWSKAGFFLYKKTALRFAEIGTEIYGGIAGSIDLPFSRYVKNSYLIYPGGGTAGINAIKCAHDYFQDDRISR